MSENEERRAGFERKKEKANQLYTHRPLHRPGLLERLLHRVLLALDRLGARVALAAAVGPGEVGLMRRGDASESAAEGAAVVVVVVAAVEVVVVVPRGRGDAVAVVASSVVPVPAKVLLVELLVVLLVREEARPSVGPGAAVPVGRGSSSSSVGAAAVGAA